MCKKKFHNTLKSAKFVKVIRYLGKHYASIKQTKRRGGGGGGGREGGIKK